MKKSNIIPTFILIASLLLLIFIFPSCGKEDHYHQIVEKVFIEDGGFDIVEVVDPCGTERDDWNDEILLIIEDGTILAFFESGNNRRLVALSPGNYKTTDGTNCHFTITNDFDIIW